MSKIRICMRLFLLANGKKLNWVMKNAIGEPEFLCRPDPTTYGFRVVITGKLEARDATYFKLKWGK